MNENYYIRYLKYKNKYLTLKSKINNEQKGGAGFYLTFSNGYDIFTGSGFSQLYKLKSILKNKEGDNWLKISLLIEKYLNNESYENENSSFIALDNKEFDIVKDLAKSLKIIN